MLLVDDLVVTGWTLTLAARAIRAAGAVSGAAADPGGAELIYRRHMTTVAVLGTGKMGAGMARQLVQHGHAVTVWNRNRDRAAPLRG